MIGRSFHDVKIGKKMYLIPLMSEDALGYKTNQFNAIGASYAILILNSIVDYCRLPSMHCKSVSTNSIMTPGAI